MAADTGTKDAKETRPRVGPAQFVREIRQEWAKTTRPTGREWRITTLMVFIMVAIATLFFFAVDSLLAFVVQLVLAS